jgi:hypothetical protein
MHAHMQVSVLTHMKVLLQATLGVVLQCLLADWEWVVLMGSIMSVFPVTVLLCV